MEQVHQHARHDEPPRRCRGCRRRTARLTRVTDYVSVSHAHGTRTTTHRTFDFACATCGAELTLTHLTSHISTEMIAALFAMLALVLGGVGLSGLDYLVSVEKVGAA